MNTEPTLPDARFVQTLQVVAREARHLAYSRTRLYAERIDAAWVQGLESHPELGERLEAFVSRFGRMQDTIANKLLPRWLLALAETPGSQIETLSRAEKLGVLENVERWLEARKLRNRLIHEYMEDAGQFAEDLRLAETYSLILFDCYNRTCRYASERMALATHDLPGPVDPATD